MDGTVELLDKTGVQVTGVIVANMYYYVSYTLCKNILATTLQGQCYYSILQMWNNMLKVEPVHDIV